MKLSQDEIFTSGNWHTPVTSRSIDVVNPATEERIGGIPDCGSADVDEAVAAARQAFDDGGWSAEPPSVRAKVLLRAADELAARAEEMARVITTEMGSPITQSRLGQVAPGIDMLKYYAHLADSYEWQASRPTWDRMNRNFEVRVYQEPVGVVGAIVPWNGPQVCTMMKLAPALLAGCTVVIKPAPEATLNFVPFAEAFAAAGLPGGVLNIVTGGAAAGESLVTHPNVDKVAFTGSVAVGKRIAALCAERLRPVTLELGGKSPAILLPDADLPRALPRLAGGMLFSSGQACNAPSRVLAPRERYDEVVAGLIAAIEAIPIGVPDAPETGVGPLASRTQRDRVLGYIEIGRSEGAKVALGGGRPAGLDRGWYVEKTIFRDVDNSMRVAREEIFGPVMVVIPFDHDADAIRIANDSNLGLGGSVWSADTERAIFVARQVRAGSVGVNAHSLDSASPLAGRRDSGLGCERGPEAIGDYLAAKGMLTPLAR